MAKKSFFILLLIFVAFNFTYAQPQVPDSGSGGGDPGGNDPGGGVPVDGGLVLLLAAGAGYGTKKAYDYRKNKVKSEK